jgi:hypothetical protein
VDVLAQIDLGKAALSQQAGEAIVAKLLSETIGHHRTSLRLVASSLMDSIQQEGYSLEMYIENKEIRTSIDLIVLYCGQNFNLTLEGILTIITLDRDFERVSHLKTTFLPLKAA